MMRKFKDWRAQTEGSSTIELLFWLPMMVTLVAVTTDATMLMNQNQNMYYLARDVSRQVAVGATSIDDAGAGIESWRAETGSTVVVEENDGFVTTTIFTPFSSISNITGIFLEGDMKASAVMWIESSDGGAGDA
ncbi:MAG: TadE/TadG family type IV pilus assembly protein [Octadecabacter sp.]